tara:strand:+ start:4339 stop:4851 length:513 start_codon:yes stop_codon:yes gene_type:complete
MKKTPFKMQSPLKDSKTKPKIQSFSNQVVQLGKQNFSQGTAAIPSQNIIPTITPTATQDADVLADSIKGLADLNAVGGKSNASFKGQHEKLKDAGAVGDAAKLAKKHAKWNMRQERKEARQDPTKSKPTKSRKESWQDFRTRNLLDYQLKDQPISSSKPSNNTIPGSRLV